MARIPAHEIEKVVIDTIRNGLIDVLALDKADDHALIDHLTNHAPSAESLVRTCLNRITVDQEKLQIDIKAETLRQILQDHLDLTITMKFESPKHVVSVPFTTRRSYKGAIILRPEKPDHDPLDLPPHELRNLVKGTIWRDEHFNGMTLPAIAARDGFSKQHFHQMIIKSMEIGANCR